MRQRPPPTLRRASPTQKIFFFFFFFFSSFSREPARAQPKAAAKPTKASAVTKAVKFRKARAKSEIPKIRTRKFANQTALAPSWFPSQYERLSASQVARKKKTATPITMRDQTKVPASK